MASLLTKFIALFFCVFLPLMLMAAADISPSNAALLGFIQSHQDPRYRIEHVPPGSKSQRDPDQETVVMVDGKKGRYECTLPREAELKDESSQQNSSSVSLLTDRRVSKTPDDLLAHLKDQCLLRYEGWWTYEFCSHGKLRQIHLENKKIVQEFCLGIYDPEATALFHKNSSNVLLQKDHRSKSAAQRYHSHILTNGTLCDLTNEPRETEVRFICSDTGDNMISSIAEVSTCKYIVIIHTPILCKHPLFQEAKPRFLAIECEELPPSPEVVVEDDIIISLPSSQTVDEQ